MKIFIEPNDVLMFRDGKPFSAGDDHYARGIFPPSPSTFYGAIRSKILSEKYPKYEGYSRSGNIPADVKEEIGTPTSPGGLTITNFLLAKKINGIITPVFPIPKDVVRLKEEKTIFILKPDNELAGKIRTNISFNSITPLWLRNEKPVEEADGFIYQDMMEKYLQGVVPDELIDTDDLYQKDARVGIKKDRIRKSAATGYLYSVEYFRLKEDVGFVVELSRVKSLPKEGLLRLGGDHRSAFYKETAFQMPDMEAIKRKAKDIKRFKLILLTPAIFKNGWFPDWIKSESGVGDVNGISLKLVSAAIGRPIPVGGFDLVKGMPKEMRKAVPQGSVYYFEIQKGTSIDEIFKTFWLKSISEERQKEGFGITIIGGY